MSDKSTGDSATRGTPEQPDDEPDFEERSIAQVGSTSRQTNILVVIFGIAIVGMLLWFVNRGDQQEATTRLTDPEPIEFEPPARRESPRMPEPESEPTRPAEAIRATPEPLQAELQRIALRQAEEQRRLAEQRRRAPILIPRPTPPACTLRGFRRPRERSSCQRIQSNA